MNQAIELPENTAPSIAIPWRFESEIRNHANLFQTRINDHSFNEAPLLCFVAGQAGYGKTRMTAETLENYGLDVHYISASSLGGQFEGDSIKPLVLAYMEASESQYSALIIDDFDMSVARPTVTYSIIC